jgi:hypothetical protein
MAASDLSPAANAFVIAPHDTNPQSKRTRAIYVGAAGNVKVTMRGAGEVTFVNVAAGTILPISVTHVWSTGTTASSMLGLY